VTLRTLRDAYWLKWGESSEWTFTGNRAEENRANFCIGLHGKPLFSTLYGMYTVTMNKLKDICNVSAQAGLSGVLNTTSVESIGQDGNFHEVKRRKRYISNNTS
jgi:hypothetical protein